MKSLNAISANYYSLLAALDLLITKKAVLPEILISAKSIEKYLSKNDLKQYQSKVKKELYNLGRQASDFLPYHLQRFLTHEVCTVMGETILKNYKFPVTFLIRGFVLLVNESKGLKLQSFFGKNTKKREIIAVGKDEVYITTLDGKTKRSIPLTQISMWKVHQDTVLFDHGRFDPHQTVIKFDTHREASDFVKFLENVVNEIMDERRGNSRRPQPNDRIEELLV
ncbi:hypothetical protein EIN_188290 [Entamoeba invadens IP1]|uniref:Uncharacterized protein n=1 Tax=Entamoeba invadens IP1 TaxID=370355 RepID=L7FQ37_ENTIV|nr:hypothetical protein EIN_188290 [Entamoeba invadens IP1]ELP92405.1 hypothetical protein EIN_188290 [Entamoeba invadens IP1]|eukprot:XP_004259176.1 hypothetical protein EIN_188290 [Entamoeba invadens IP1]